MAGAAKSARARADAREAKGAEPEVRRPEETEPVLRMHTLDAPVHVTYFTPADMAANAQAVVSRLPTKDLIFYGGLGALAVAGALDWPVALAVGGAAWIIRGGRKEGIGQRREPGDGSARPE